MKKKKIAGIRHGNAVAVTFLMTLGIFNPRSFAENTGNIIMPSPDIALTDVGKILAD